MKIVKRIAALVLVLAITTAVFVSATEDAYISIRQAAYANGATVAWDAARGAVIITRSDNSNYVLVVGEHGSFNDSGTIFMPVTQMKQLFVPVPDATNIHGGLHRIEHAGSVAYLFGSFHHGVDDWFPLACVVESAMHNADVFMFEIDFSINEDEVTDILNAMLLLPHGQTIADILCEELYTHYISMITDWAAAFPGILNNVYNANPAFLITSLQQLLMSRLFDTGSGVTVDGYVMNFAMENERAVIGLMDFEAQHRVILAPPHEIVLYMVAALGTLVDATEEMQNSTIEHFNRLMYYYSTNNTEGLVHEMHPYFNIEEETVYQRYTRYVVLNDRSALFAAELVRHMEEAAEPTVFFVTVGKSHLVRHLAGPQFTSTIEQLELMGIEAVPMF